MTTAKIISDCTSSQNFCLFAQQQRSKEVAAPPIECCISYSSRNCVENTLGTEHDSAFSKFISQRTS